MLLGVQLRYRRFFSEIRGFIVKICYTFTIQSVHRWPLLSPIFRVAYESRVEKTGHLLRLSTNRSNFLLLHKTGSSSQPGRVPLIETSDSQREQRLENTAGGVGLPISTFPSTLTTFVTWGRALSCCKITLSYLSLYCGRLSFNARLKRINCVRYRSPVIVSVGFNSS